MVNKSHKLSYNKEYYTVMANDIIKGKQEMSLQEARIIRLLITQVVKEDKDLKTYTCRIKDLADFLGIHSENLYRDIRGICKQLLKRTVDIGTGNPKDPWESFQWIQLAKYDNNGNITLMLSEQIKKYVIDLNCWFTQYPLGSILSMQSFYAIRLYELLKCYDGISRYEKEYYEFSLKYLREFFCCEDKFIRISDFKRKVIDIAIKEINDKTDIWIDVEYVKLGRAINSIKFYIHFNPKNVKNVNILSIM
jgi:plasmid replication initiation protein